MLESMDKTMLILAEDQQGMRKEQGVIKEKIEHIESDMVDMKFEIRELKFDVRELKSDMKEVKGELVEVNFKLDRKADRDDFQKMEKRVLHLEKVQS